MTSKHIETRRLLKAIPTKKEFESILDQSTLTPDDQILLRMHYLEGKDFRFIGDTLGFSESTIKYRHQKALRKIGDIILSLDFH